MCRGGSFFPSVAVRRQADGPVLAMEMDRRPRV